MNSLLLFFFLITTPFCFSFLNNWIPVVSISSTDFTHPQPLDILGKTFVLWKKENIFVLQDDVCPHRFAPLSEGYFDDVSKNLRCAYHGWEFNETGHCQTIPQSNLTVFSPKSCLFSYPTCIFGDLLWVNLGKTNISSPYEKYVLSDSPFFVREVPYSLPILMENFFDPAHIPFAHHKLQSLRKKASPIIIQLLFSNNEMLSILFRETHHSKRTGIMNFESPGYYFLTNLRPSKSIFSGLHIFGVPVDEGKTRVFIQYHWNRKHIAYSLVKNLPLWLLHSFTNKFLDSDSYLLYLQEKHIRETYGDYFNKTPYFLPTSSDQSVIYFKHWATKYFPVIPFFRKSNHRDLTKKEALDRWNQHTSHCKHCKRAYNIANRLQKIGTVLFSIAFVYSKNIVFRLLAIVNFVFFHEFQKQFNYVNYIHNKLK